jgi:hypothetical protein
MKLPSVQDPERYRGLYVFDFGEWAALGYTAEEIALLLESERFQDGKVFRIHRAGPDGSLELRGVSHVRFALESAVGFYRQHEADARRDFERLQSQAGGSPAPCRTAIYLADLGAAQQPERYLTLLVFPAEYDDDIGGWLTAIGFDGGDRAEGGASLVTGFQDADKRILERDQLWSRHAPSRSREEVYASVRRAVQR